MYEKKINNRFVLPLFSRRTSNLVLTEETYTKWDRENVEIYRISLEFTMLVER